MLLLSTAYLPPIDYFIAIRSADKVLIESLENYQKQSYRTRSRIISADGPLTLSVPVKHAGVSDTHHSLISDIRIDYGKPWIQQHKRALISSYNSSPFFIYYQDDLFAILDHGYEYLLDLNMALLDFMMEQIGLSVPIEKTTEWMQPSDSLLLSHDITDLRKDIHPKHPSPFFRIGEYPVYYQLFSDRLGFQYNLSVVDLLFNEGPASITYLNTFSIL